IEAANSLLHRDHVRRFTGRLPKPSTSAAVNSRRTDVRPTLNNGPPVHRRLRRDRAKGNPTLSSTSSYSYKEIASFSDLTAFDRPLAFDNWPTWSFPWTILPEQHPTVSASISKCLPFSRKGPISLLVAIAFEQLLPLPRMSLRQSLRFAQRSRRPPPNDYR